EPVAVEPAPAPEPEPAPAPERSRRVVRSSAQPLPPRAPEPFERTTPLTERRPGERPISPITDKPTPVDRPAAASVDAPPDDVAAPPSRPLSQTGRPIPPPPGQRPSVPPRGPIGGPPRSGGSRPSGGPGGPPRSGFGPRGGGGGAGGGFGAGAPPAGGPGASGSGAGRGGGRGAPGGGPGGGYGGPAGRGRPGGPPQRRRKKRRRDRSELEPASQRLTPLDTPVPEGEIVVSRGVTVQELAPKLNRTPADLVRILFEAGEMVTATVSLADEMIELIAETLGAQVLLVEPGSEQEVEFLAMLSEDDEDDALLEPRAPVVTVLGHVDHGKTTLLDTIVLDVSAPTGVGVDELLDSILLVADVQLADELVANPKKPAVAAVLEAHLDQGRGPVVSVLVEEGTLMVGETIVAGPAWGRIRAMFDEAGSAVSEAGPSVPVEVLGLADVPMAGDEVRVAPNDKIAR